METGNSYYNDYDQEEEEEDASMQYSKDRSERMKA